RCTARSTMRLGPSSEVKSTASVATRSGSPMAFSRSLSRLSSRPVPSTAMPISASLVAHPKPMPLLAPVTIAICMSFTRLRQRRPDLMFQQFSRVVLGQAFGDNHLLRHFELGNAVFGQECAQALDVGAWGGFGDDDGACALSGAGIGQADDGDL